VKKSFWPGLILTLYLLSGCLPSAPAQTSSQPSGLQISDMTVSVGAAERNSDTQIVSYEVTVHNAGTNDIALDWIEPVLQDSVSSRALEQNLRVMVNETVTPNSTLAVKGSFAFDASGLTKADMDNWRFIDQIRLSSERTIPVPSGDNKP